MTTAVAPIFAVSGDAVMTLDDEQQWAFTAHDLGGPLAPLPIRTAWAQRFHSGDVPHYLVGTFVAPGPFQGSMDVHVAAARAWGSGTPPFGSFGGGGFGLILVDTTTFRLPRGKYGPDPFDLSVVGVVSPTNYPAARCCGLVALPATYSVENAAGGPYGLGYRNDGSGGWTPIAPAPPWSNDPASLAGGDITFATGLQPNDAYTALPAHADAIWPLVAGRTYAVYAVPQAVTFLWDIGKPGNIWGWGGWEDYPSFGTPGDHITVPDVRAAYPFAWPQYDPPVVPASWPPYDPPAGVTRRWKVGHSTVPGDEWADVSGGLHPPGPTPYHYRTGQRFHAEVSGLTVSASGVLVTIACDPPCVDPATCVSGTCVTPPPPASESGFPWWILLLAGGAVAVGAAEKHRKHQARR